MDFRSLRYFLAVANCLNFSRAAETLFISQPSLSQQIKLLEDRLGVALFERSGKSVRLTASGEVLYDGAARLLYDSDRLREQVVSVGRERVSEYHLHVHLDTLTGNDFSVCSRLSLAVTRLKADFPFLRLFFVEREPSDSPSIYSDRETDFWLTTSSTVPESGDMIHEVISKDRFVLGVCGLHPLYREDLTPRELLEKLPLFILRNRPGGYAVILKLVADMNVSPKIVFIDSSNIIALFVASSEGVVILPESRLRQLDIPHIASIPLKADGETLCKIASYRAGDENPVLPILMRMLLESDTARRD